MYEIQMMGVMESEQSNISIPYLIEGQGVSRTQNPGLSPAAPNRAPFRDSSSYRPFRDNLRNPRNPLPGGPKKKSQKSVLSWMDQY
ncbi:hypothetical protein JS756_36075, partial [Streptomyces actuosus]|nr:hypothetical protein [Streptomyces actuosus]